MSVTAGVLLRFVVGLQPVWWLAWVAPALLLALAYRQHHTTTARAVVLTAALFGAGGVTFVVALVASALALVLAFGVQQRFAALAARLHVWIAIGVGVDDNGRRTRRAGCA